MRDRTLGDTAQKPSLCVRSNACPTRLLVVYCPTQLAVVIAVDSGYVRSNRDFGASES